jgi:hypothetical protein
MHTKLMSTYLRDQRALRVRFDDRRLARFDRAGAAVACRNKNGPDFKTKSVEINRKKDKLV